MTNTAEPKQPWFALGLARLRHRAFKSGGTTPRRTHIRPRQAFIPKVSKSLYENLQRAVGATSLASGFPRPWDEVAPGHLVLSEEVGEIGEGYWECIVQSRENDVLTLRFRDYPKVAPFRINIALIALINPGQRQTLEP